MSKNVTEEVYLCIQCIGRGQNQIAARDRLTGDYNTSFVDCHTCQGAGRMLKITTITDEPYSKQ